MIDSGWYGTICYVAFLFSVLGAYGVAHFERVRWLIRWRMR